MVEKRGIKTKFKLGLLLWFTIIYILFFTGFSIWQSNYEFLFYVFFIFIIVILLALYYKVLHFPYSLLVLISILGVFNFLGGTVHISGIRLYDYTILSDSFRYDNFMHIFMALVYSFIGYNVLRPHLDVKIKLNPAFFVVVLVLISLGIGVLNEITEFLGVVFFGAAKGVGGYLNNALDLVYNVVGAILGALFIVRKHNKLFL